jgi:hypothetical protein
MKDHISFMDSRSGFRYCDSTISTFTQEKSSLALSCSAITSKEPKLPSKHLTKSTMVLSILKLSGSGLRYITQPQRKHSCPMRTRLPRKTHLWRSMSVCILFGKCNTKRKLLAKNLIIGNNMRDCIFYYVLLDLPFQHFPSS